MHQNLGKISGVMKHHHGLEIDVYEEAFLSKALGKRLRSTGLDFPTYLTMLASDPAEARAMHASLNISYSTFFRNALTFALLEQYVLPNLWEHCYTQQRELRIWSAACAAGQEPYSVAILLDELSESNGHPVRYRLFATDHSENELSQAKRGVYDAGALQNVRYKHLNTYFRQHEDGFAVSDRLKSTIDFSRYDVLDAHSACPPQSIFGEFDLILCSNLLFYYREDQRTVILRKLEKNLASTGYLVTGEAEREIVKTSVGFRSLTPFAPIFNQSHQSRRS